MNRPLLFPNVKQFSDLFEVDRSPPVYERSGFRNPILYAFDDTRFSGNSLVLGAGEFESFYIRHIPRPEVLAAILPRLVIPDRMYFEFIRQSGNPAEVLVTCQYNTICGSFWLAYIDGRDLPADTAPHTLTRAEIKAPPPGVTISDRERRAYINERGEILDA